MSNPKQIEITWASVFKVLFSLFLVYLAFLLKDILLWFLFALIISIIFNPSINWLVRRGVPRSLASVFVYVVFFFFIAMTVYLIIPPIIIELQSFSQNFDYSKSYPLIDEFGANYFQNLESLSDVLKDQLVKVSANLFDMISSLFGSIFAGITVIVLALFLSIEEKEIQKAIKLIVPKRSESIAMDAWKKSQDQVIGYFGGKLWASIAVGIMTFALCYFLGIKYALSLALLAAVFNIIPVIGPIISCVFILFFGLDSLVKALIVIIGCLIIQQIESNLLVPIFTKKMIGLPIVLVLMSILIGAKLGGLVGAILIIPVAGIIYEFTKNYFKNKKERVEALMKIDR